jgi:hypothetical protein
LFLNRQAYYPKTNGFLSDNYCDVYKWTIKFENNNESPENNLYFAIISCWRASCLRLLI